MDSHRAPESSSSKEPQPRTSAARSREEKAKTQKDHRGKKLFFSFSFFSFFPSFDLKEETKLLLWSVPGYYLDLLAERTASSLFRKRTEQI